jgi:hypothetical protein
MKAAIKAVWAVSALLIGLSALTGCYVVPAPYYAYGYGYYSPYYYYPAYRYYYPYYYRPYP